MLEVCSGCIVDSAMQLQLDHHYTKAALASGYVINPLKPIVLNISETGYLPDGKAYLRGVVANLPFRIADPNPGESLASVTAKLVLYILPSPAE